jgi:hypothetical protein
MNDQTETRFATLADLQNLEDNDVSHFSLLLKILELDGVDRVLTAGIYSTQISLDRTPVEIYKNLFRGEYPRFRKIVIDHINQAYNEVEEEEAEQASNDSETHS